MGVLLVGHGLSLICSVPCLSPSLWKTAQYSLKYCPKGPFDPKQPARGDAGTRSIIMLVVYVKRDLKPGANCNDQINLHTVELQWLKHLWYS